MRKKIYYWASNTKKNSGEGILALKFLKLLKKTNNPYEKKNTSDRIIKVLKRIDFAKIKTKEFFDYKLS